MGSSFETDGGEVVVIHTDGRVRRSPIPDGFDRETFRNILAAVDVLFRRNGVFPTVEETYKSWPKIAKKTYSRAFATSEFKQALELRGISTEPMPGLSPEQAHAVLLLSLPDGKTLQSKLKQLGISHAKYTAWMRQPLFAETLRNRAEQNLGDSVSIALNRLVDNADRGDQRAIEKVLEISGRYNPNQIEQQNAKQVVLIMVEAVLKHVSSPDEKKAILAEVERAMTKSNIMDAIGTVE